MAAESFISKVEAFFKKADRDCSGELSVSELGSCLREMGWSNEDIVNLFQEMDTGGDKSISWEEFKTQMMKKNPKQVQENELKACFQQYDKDGSGLITEDELKAAFAKIGTNISDKKVKEIIAKADADKDGKINYAEFLKTWKEG